MNIPYVEVYTDGSCLKNPGPGGWASIILRKTPGSTAVRTKTLCGGEADTTNNRMELLAVIRALEWLPKGKYPVVLYTDSQYVCKAITENWLHSWVAKSWRTSSGSPVKNVDLWQRFQAVLESRAFPSFKAHWVKGHAACEYNNKCDILAREQAQSVANTTRS